jgi:valyl-tRNA synthetase
VDLTILQILIRDATGFARLPLLHFTATSYDVASRTIYSFIASPVCRNYCQAKRHVVRKGETKGKKRKKIEKSARTTCGSIIAVCIPLPSID